MQSLPVVGALALLCCFLWGSAAPSIKTGYRIFQIASDDVATVLLFAGIRFLLAGILAVVLGSFLQKKPLVPKSTSWGKIVLLAFIQTVLQYIFYYVGLAHASGVRSAIVNSTNTFCAILIACFLFRQETLTGKKILGCVLGFAGVVIVNLSGLATGSPMTFLGEGFIFLSSVCYAFSSAFLKEYSKEENPVALSGYQFILGSIIMIVIGLAMGGRLTVITPGGILLLVYMALISAVAYTVWGILLKYNPVSRITIFGFMNPVFSVILSAIILQEMGLLGPPVLLALVLVSLGIIVVNRPAPAPRPAT